MFINAHFVFIRDPKTACSYMGHLFTRNDIPYVLSGVGDVPNFTIHSTATEIIKFYLGRERWDKLFTFCVFRNPFIRAISLYEYQIRHGFRERQSFEYYVRVIDDDHMRQSDYVVDENNRVVVTWIYKLEDGVENIISDINRRCNLDIKMYYDLPKNKNEEITGKYDVRKYFDNAPLIDYFVDKYLDDFTIGGYSTSLEGL